MHLGAPEALVGHETIEQVPLHAPAAKDRLPINPELQAQVGWPLALTGQDTTEQVPLHVREDKEKINVPEKPDTHAQLGPAPALLGHVAMVVQLTPPYPVAQAHE